MRARNLKPAIFKNEFLATLDPNAFILFTGLWCLSDREGRLEDRPDRIEAEIFPFKFQKVKVDHLLDLLSNQPEPFIRRYIKNGKRYIQIINFSRHQFPHHREQASSIPPMESTSLGLSLGKPQSSPSESPILNPESPILNPESLTPPLAPAAPSVPYEDFLNTYNENRGPLPEAKTLNDDRRLKMRIRWAKNPDLGYWKAVTMKLAVSDLAQKWASLDWMLANDKNHIKAMEGNYDNRRNGDFNAGKNNRLGNQSVTAEAGKYDGIAR